MYGLHGFYCQIKKLGNYSILTISAVFVPSDSFSHVCIESKSPPNCQLIKTNKA